MKCIRCEKEAAHQYCDSCLISVIERRAKRALAPLTKDATVLIVNDKSCQGHVNEYLARKLITVTKKVMLAPVPEGSDFILFPDTTDARAEKLIEQMMHSRASALKGKPIYLLKESLAEEIEQYARVMNLPCPASMKSEAAKMLDHLESRLKGAKSALAKAFDQLNN